MPWVRIDENAMDHPKFLALSDGAWRLWCEGQAYCQKHLTDGRINAAALRGFRYYSLSRVKNLTTVHVEGKGPCWVRMKNGDVQVHDYLDWNDTAAEVLHARSNARERKRRYNDRHAFRNGVPDAEITANASSGVYVSGRSDLPERGLEKTNGHELNDSPAAAGPELSNRAGNFLERYKSLYVKHRKGAHYVGKPNLDFLEALELVRTWDDERLDKIATVFLTTDHEFAEKGSRTIAQFRSLASWCDSQLREAGL